MPQPLSRVKADAEINVGVGALMTKPQFLPQIMRVVAYWAQIDGDLATTFSLFLKVDIETGTAVYQAFNGVQARKIALFAAATKALPEWQLLALRAVWNATKASRNQRDKFAHHIWGASEQIPDALLLMHSSVVVDRNVSYRQSSHQHRDGRGVIAPRDFDRSKVFVYRKADFDRAASDAGAASFLVGLLYFAIGQHWNEVGRRQLLNEPLFQRAVQPLIREKSPEVQAQLGPPGNDPPVKGISELWDRVLGRMP